MSRAEEEDERQVESWSVNRNLALRPNDQGLTATTSLSREPLVIAYELLPLLQFFAEPTSLEHGVQSFLGRYAEADSQPELVEQVWEFAQALQDAAILVPMTSAVSDEDALGAGWYAQASPHILMLSDVVRTMSYREVVTRHAPGRVVAEIGCGSGFFACCAALAGAQRVYAIEETSMLETAKRIATLNGVDDKIEFVAGNSRNVELPERVDVLYSELIGSDPLEEGIIPALADAKQRLLKPNGTMIPRRLSIWTVGIYSPQVAEAGYLFEQKERAAKELSGTYGVDLAPLIDAYVRELEAKGEEYGYLASIGDFVGCESPSRPEVILTSEAIVMDIKLDELESFHEREATIAMKVGRGGTHNAMLTYFKAELDDSVSFSTSPHAPQPSKNWWQVVTALDPQEVREGDHVKLDARIVPDVSNGIAYQRKRTKRRR